MTRRRGRGTSENRGGIGETRAARDGAFDRSVKAFQFGKVGNAKKRNHSGET